MYKLAILLYIDGLAALVEKKKNTCRGIDAKTDNSNHSTFLCSAVELSADMVYKDG